MDKVLGLDRKVWSAILILLQFVSICLMIGAVTVDYWFYMKFDQLGNFKLKGGLLEPKSDSDCDTYLSCYDDCNSNCDQIRAWAFSGVIYACLDSFALLFSLISILFLLFSLIGIRSCRKLASISGTFCFTLMVFILHSAAFIEWAIYVKLAIDDCKHSVYYTGGIMSVCAEEGAIFSIVISVYLFFLTVLHFILSRKAAHQEKEHFSELLNR